MYINSVLKEQDFAIDLFLKELDRNQLVYLCYWQENSDKFEDIIDYQLENFEKNINSLFSFKNITTKKMLEKLIGVYNKENYRKIIAENFYISNVKNEYQSGDKLLTALFIMIDLMFTMKTGKLSNRIDYNISITSSVESIYPISKPFTSYLGILRTISMIKASENENRIDNELYTSLYLMLLRCFNKMCIVEKGLLKKDSQSYKKEIRLLTSKSNTSIIEMEQLKKALKETNESELIVRLHETLNQKDNQINKLQKEIKEANSSFPKQYQDMMEDYGRQIATLKSDMRQKSLETKGYKKDLEYLKNRKITDILKEYLAQNGMTDDISKILLNYSQFKEIAQVQAQAQEESISQCQQTPEYWKTIGYCTIEECIHYIILLDGIKNELLDIPEKVFLSQNQFVLIDNSFKFRWSYNIRYESGNRDNEIDSFAKIVYKDNIFYLDKGNLNYERLLNVPLQENLQENQIVSVDKNNNFIRVYRWTKGDAFYLKDSIAAKGFTLAYVLKKFQKGVLIRNIETSEESFKEIDMTNKNINEQNVLVLKDNTVITCYSSKFYTGSFAYTQTIGGVAVFKNGQVFLRKITGELVLINNFPKSIIESDDYNITVDENYNFIRIKSRIQEITPYEPKKIKSSTKKIDKPDEEKNSVDMKKKVLILGNKEYSINYRKALLKEGYECTVVDGFETWAVISSEINEVDIIVIIGAFISHENMWTIKDNIDKPIIYSKYDGANRIVEQIIEFDKKSV